MDGFLPSSFNVTFNTSNGIDYYTFENSSGDKMIAVFLEGIVTSDGIVESSRNITIPGITATQAFAYDVLNGTQQQLVITHSGGDTVINAVLVKDYPVFIKLE